MSTTVTETTVDVPSRLVSDPRQVAPWEPREVPQHVNLDRPNKFEPNRL
jgi:hypothetical protein